MQSLANFNKRVNESLTWLAGFALLGMMLFTVADMVLRALGRPVAGSYEVIGWLSAAALALALGNAQIYRSHVAIDLVTTQLGDRTRSVVDLAMSLLSLLLFAAAAWFVARYGRVLQDTGSLSETLKAPVYPWVYLVAGGVAGLALALLVDLLRSIGRFAAAWRTGA